MRRNMLGWCVMAAVLALSTPAVAHVETSIAVAGAPTHSETLAAAAPSLDGLGTPLIT